MISVYITKEDEVYKVTLTPEATWKLQLLSSLMLKSQTLSHYPFFQTPTSMTPVASPYIKKVLSVVLTVGPEHFKSIRKETCTPAYVLSKMSGACHPQDLLTIEDQPEGPLPLTASERLPCH